MPTYMVLLQIIADDHDAAVERLATFETGEGEGIHQITVNETIAVPTELAVPMPDMSADMGVLATFSIDPADPAQDVEVTFDASASAGMIASYGWDFGDSQSGSGQIATHVYNSKGNYDVKLLVVGGTGESDEVTQTVKVS